MEPTPQCPRCGYDQSGVITTWQDTCPLHGTCAECGLALAWREVFSTRWRGPSSWVECPSRVTTIIGAAFVAPLVASVPWWLCRRLTMRDPIRPARWILVPLVWCIMFRAYVVWHVPVLRSLSLTTMRWTEYRELVVGLGMPWFVRLPPQSWSASLASQASWITSELFRVWGVEVMLAKYACFSVGIGFAAFAVLPVARARAKVRWRHIVRASVIVLFSIPFAVTFGGMAIRASSSLLGLSGYEQNILLIDIRAFVAAMITVSLWLLLWWHAIAHWYLRMTRPWAVAASIASMSTLAVALAISFRQLLFH